ncbi:MAG: hypothetical protein GTN99_03495, partial [Candidatus Dadabacteria bacterium]|nr:hypothetical protein [Candidatus Dadabacteria bacterium]NIT13325.1 hypothetical protein [Candidatus Dadabacteria bacterium]
RVQTSENFVASDTQPSDKRKKRERSRSNKDSNSQNAGSDGKYTVQIASYKNEKDALELADKLESKGYEVYITKARVPQKGTWYRVRIGSYSSKNEAGNFGTKLTQS